MTKLKELFAYGTCGICDKGISNINVFVLYANHNDKITNVNHMTN